MNSAKDTIVEICQVLNFYAKRLSLMRVQNTAEETLTRGYLSSDNAHMAYLAVSPWYRVVEPLYAELEASIQGVDFALSKAVLEEPKVRSRLAALQKIRAAYEFDKETEEAQRILSAEDPGVEINRILDHQFYWILTPFVLQAIRDAKTIAVIGSGPLPLTPIALANSVDAKIVCFEGDKTGFQTGLKIIEKAGLSNRIECRQEFARPGPDFTNFDVVFCAVLLGVKLEGEDHTPKKDTLAGFLYHMGPTGKILIRDPFQLGELFYPPANIDGEAGINVERRDPTPVKGDPYRSSFLLIKKADPNG